MNHSLRIGITLVFLGSTLAASAFADSFSKVPNFIAQVQEDKHHGCWAAVTQMLLQFKDPALKISQCEIASKVKGLDCCALADRTECYEGTRLEEGWAAYGLAYEHVQKDENRWPINPEKIIEELKGNNLVVFRWERGPGKAKHVSIAAGYGEEDGERFIYVADSAIGELKIYESSWDYFFPHVIGLTEQEFDELPVPYAYRAWLVPK